MSDKLTAKQEAFAQAILAGMTQADAYRTAYGQKAMKNETVQQAASRLMANSKVSARVAQLRAPVTKKLQYGLEQAMEEAMAAYNVALEKGNGGAMVAAAQLRAKLNGLLVERKEIRSGPLSQASDAQLDMIIESKAREAGVSLH